MKYKSTRSKAQELLSSEAIIKGISSDGGLFVPSEIPKVDMDYYSLAKMDYKELAYYIMNKYFTDFDESILKDCIAKAYDDKFETPAIAPLVECDGMHFLELYHGPTLAFKDMALSILPHLLKAATKKQSISKEVVILTATSGDTGKAALEGFANVEGTKIIVFFPQNGVSEIQKRQMITQEGENTFVVAIEGNFDDAQNGVKEIFNDKEFSKELENKGYLLSSANSINIGRLVPQIVYYFYGYLSLAKHGKIEYGSSINVVVPTGNFGNILAAYYAKKMGLPINKLICASNENNILSDFFNTGIYDRRRDLSLTSSPSMDIIISSNLERLLYELSNRDEALINNLMDKLSREGIYQIPHSMKAGFQDFFGDYATEAEVIDSIQKLYAKSGYIMDTHTAVAYSVYKKYKQQTLDETPTIIVSTASPFKFAKDVADAIGIKDDYEDYFELIDQLSRAAGLHVPSAVSALKNKAVVHNILCKKQEMKSTVKNFLKV